MCSEIKILNDLSIRASKKNNRAIILILNNNNEKFGIITYHMPCEPNFPIIALLHFKALYKKIKKMMNNIPWFLAGDFNSLPESIGYKYISKITKCIWKDNLLSYPITNHSYILNKNFNGCLDYIFYSKKGYNCDNININKHQDQIMPTKIEPSDHYPVIANFSIN